MPKVDLKKSLSDMNEQEKMIYYFLNGHKGMDDRWKKIREDFRKLHENEERIVLQLELEEAQKKEEADKKVNQMNQEFKQMIQLILSNGMSLEYVSKSLSKSEDEILDLMK